MNKIYLILISLLILSCDEKLGTNQASARPNDIVYFIDRRTDLCFAYMWGGDYHGGPALSNVPCEKVQKFLKEKPNF